MNRWKAQPIEFLNIEHGYSMASDYYVSKMIKGIRHFKITLKGGWKLKEKRLTIKCHNFLVYLKGSGNRLKTNTEFENGDMR